MYFCMIFPVLSYERQDLKQCWFTEVNCSQWESLVPSTDYDCTLGLRPTDEHQRLRHPYFMMPKQSDKGALLI